MNKLTKLTPEVLDSLFQSDPPDDPFCEHNPQDYVHVGYISYWKNLYYCLVCKKKIRTSLLILSPETEAALNNLEEFNDEEINDVLNRGIEGIE